MIALGRIPVAELQFAYITQLIEWGTEFDRAGTKLAFTREAAHSRSHLLDDSGQLHPRRERERRLHLGEALHEQSVGKVQRAGLPLDDDFVRAGSRRGDVFHAQPFDCLCG